MTLQPRSTGEHAAWAGDRHILVPPDIIAVPRRSPVRARKRTPWHPPPEGQSTTRPGCREWFSDRLFVETQRTEMRAACGTSLTAHASCLIGLMVVVLTESNPLPPVRISASLVMPAIVATVPVVGEASTSAAAPRRAGPSVPKSPLTPAPPPPAVASAPVPAPLETPSEIAPETGQEGGAEADDDGVPGGITGGVGGGEVGGLPGWHVAGGTGSGSGAGAPGPLRLRAGMEPPRKIKDAKPIYPPQALADEARGSVVVEATVGIDGRVVDAKVVRSILQLDAAALAAVRQWEFLPARLNGAPVAVIITVVVNFAIY